MNYIKLQLETSVRYLKGVGPKREALLRDLGISTVKDLVLQTPRAWEDRRLKSQDLPKTPGARVGFSCRVTKAREIWTRDKNYLFYKAESETQNRLLPRVVLTWIRRHSRFDPFAKLRRECRPGQDLLAFGRLSSGGTGHVELFVEEYELLDGGFLPKSSPHWMRLAPVYPATQGIHQRQLREWRWTALNTWRAAAEIWNWPEEWTPHLPAPLLPVAKAYAALHFPQDEQERAAARKTLAFWEALHLALAMEWRRRETVLTAKPQRYTPKTASTFDRLIKDSAVNLTAGQRQAISDIQADMAKSHPMNRLVQGEVGSGKTFVALAAICQALACGHQAAFFAPTEILMFQHYTNFKSRLEPLGIRIACLSSEMPANSRRLILEELAGGKLHVIVGTHALLDDQVNFSSLGLIVIDEQQRFGVDQRWKLRAKAAHPDCLILSATPIPRTLALGLYGDLEISTIEDLPPGHVIAPAAIADSPEAAWRQVHEWLGKGRQAYVVVPAIEMGSHFFNLEKTLSELSLKFPGISIAALHGKMSLNDKKESLEAFAAGRSPIMVATTVIEVGIDVKQAGVIVVLGADRFGLATLHQLRGRVGRGSEEGLCLLVPSPKTNDEMLEDPSDARKRLEKFCGCRSGFEIGRLDLEWRGPGDLLGWSQHGGGRLRHFDWSTDTDLIGKARDLAKEILQSDPQWTQYISLRRGVQERFGANFLKSDIS